MRSFHLNKLTIPPLVRQRCDPSAVVSLPQTHYSASDATAVRPKCDRFTSTKSLFRLWCDIGAIQVRSFHFNKITIPPLVRHRCDPSAIVLPCKSCSATYTPRLRFILFKGGRGGGGAGEGRDAVGAVGAHSIVVRTCAQTGFGIRFLLLFARRKH